MLHEHGCEVHVAAKDNLEEKNGLKLDFVEKVYNIPFARSPKSTDNIRAYTELKKIIDTEHYDVVHCNTPMGGVVTRLAAIQARKKGTKVYYTAHGFHFYKGAPKKNWLLFYPVEKFFSRLTDKLITITTEDYDLARKKFHCQVEHIHGVGADSSKFSLLSEEEKNDLKTELGFSKDTKVILNVGELLPNKNQKSAIAAMELIVKQIPGSILLIAGNGPEKEKLQSLVDEKQLSGNVELLGYTTEMQKYMNIADVLIACSYREGLPLNLMEAMLCKKPIVASINRGHRELIHHGENGFLVQPDDISGFAESVMQLLLNDKLKTKMGDVGYCYILNYTDESIMYELRIIYEL
jgi:glycosyltransferase EpsD